MFAVTHLRSEKGGTVNTFVLPVWLLVWGEVIHVHRLLQDQTRASVWSSFWTLSIPCRENKKRRCFANFCKLTPFSLSFLPPTPILSGKVKIVVPVPASPAMCQRGTHLPAYVFCASLPRASSLYSPTLNRADVNPCSISAFSGGLMDRGFSSFVVGVWVSPSLAELLSSMWITANAWGHPCAWLCPLCVSVSPSTATVRVRNMRRGYGQDLSVCLPLRARDLWERTPLCLGNTASEAGGAGKIMDPSCQNRANPAARVQPQNCD